MPTNRFQFSDDFVLNNGNVGINSATPQEKLDVVGVVKGQDLKVVGVSSFTIYEGFLSNIQNVTENINLEAGNGISGSLSGETVVGTGLTLTGIGSAISGQGYIDSLKVYNTFTVPVGGTLDRPASVRKGMLFYNRDFATIEFWDGDRWRQVDNVVTSGRGIIAGGTTNIPAQNTIITTINYINIMSLGNSIDFGNLTEPGSQPSSASSSTRGIFAGRVGVSPTFTESKTIDYVTISSSGNAQDFGDLPVATRAMTQGVSSSTRGIFAGGVSPASTNVINYVQISTLGDAKDFGDLIQSAYGVAGVSSPTRGIFNGASSQPTMIQYLTISTTGNTVRFGDLVQLKTDGGTVGSSVRGISVGTDGDNRIKAMDYITIASTGNALNFGDLTVGKLSRGCSTQIRGVFTGGASSPTQTNIMDYVTIASTGNAQDFGDLHKPLQQHGTVSDSHGGLGGF